MIKICCFYPSLVFEERREVRDEVDYRKSKWGKKGHDVEQKL